MFLLYLILSACQPSDIEVLALRTDQVEIETLAQPTRWCSTPDIIICENQILIDELEVDTAFRLIGYDNPRIIKAQCSEECTAIVGAITIGKPLCFLELDTTGTTLGMAVATPQLHNSTCIQYSRVELWKWNLRVMTHEAGHSLGYKHTDTKGHLMNPVYSNGGWNLDGISQHLKTNPL